MITHLKSLIVVAVLSHIFYAFPVHAAIQAALYVTPGGTAGNITSCSLAAPCTLTQARDKVRLMNRTNMTGDIVIYLRGTQGPYRLNSTFELTAADSGNYPCCQVVYQGYPGDPAPVLSGGVTITNWTRIDPVKNIWQATVPVGLQTRQLFVNGVRAQRARTDVPTTENMYGLVLSYDNQGNGNGYYVSDEGLRGWIGTWRNITDVEAVDNVSWRHCRCPVAWYGGGVLGMYEPCWGLNRNSGDPYIDMGIPMWLENAYELLDLPGEWYHDRSANYIYYIPRPGENLATAEVIAPKLEALVSVTGTADSPAHHITFSGIVFSHTTWLQPSTSTGYASKQAGVTYTGTPSSMWQTKTPGAVRFTFAQGMLLLRNVFQRLGGAGLSFDNGSQWNQVFANVFEDISGGAIMFGDVYPTDDPRYTTHDNVLRDNYIAYIARIGREYFDAVGILVGYAANTYVDHNELYDLPYTGISVGWGWGGNDPTWVGNNQITHNRVQNVAQRLRDGGMVYTLGKQGTSSSHSVIGDNYLVSQTHEFAGIYLDEGSQSFTIRNNVFSSAPYWLLLQTLGAGTYDITIENNNHADWFARNAWSNSAQFINVNQSSGAWPSDNVARTIMNNSGIEAAYWDIRPPKVRVEAESFNRGGQGIGYYDTTAGNTGEAYRMAQINPSGGVVLYEDVDIWPCNNCSNDYTVGQPADGEILHYSVYIDKDGTYDFEFSVATVANNSRIQLVVDSQPGGQTINLPNTGSWGNYQLAPLLGIPLTKGPHVLSTVFTAGSGFGFDYFT